MADPQKTDYLQMSDEEFLNQTGPAPVNDDEGKADAKAEEDQSGEETNQEEDDSSLGSNEDDGTGDEENADDKSGDEENTDKSDGESDDDGESDQGQSGDAATDTDAGDGKAKADVKPEGTEGAAADPQDKAAAPKVQAKDEIEPKETAAESLYERLLSKPIKANGKNIQLKSVDEVVGLVQMGANYTRRMQEIAPFRKTLMTLQQKDLMDPEKLSFLIDLHEKKPEAIRKLVKDSGIDALDLDNDSNEEYTPTDHSVSDNAVTFQTMLEQVADLEGGRELIHDVDKKWDAVSKEAVWQNPDLLMIMQQQRELGVYDLITAEVDRLKALGTISATVPFLQAYKTAGDALQAKGAFEHLAGSEQSDSKTDSQQDTKTGQSGSERKVIATRAAAPKSQVANGDKVGAAGTQRASGKTGTAQKKLNPLAMSDEEFLKLDKELIDRL